MTPSHPTYISSETTPSLQLEHARRRFSCLPAHITFLEAHCPCHPHILSILARVQRCNPSESHRRARQP